MSSNISNIVRDHPEFSHGQEGGGGFFKTNKEKGGGANSEWFLKNENIIRASIRANKRYQNITHCKLITVASPFYPSPFFTCTDMFQILRYKKPRLSRICNRMIYFVCVYQCPGESVI